MTYVQPQHPLRPSSSCAPSPTVVATGRRVHTASQFPSFVTTSTKLQRLQIRCVAATGEEEVLIVPVSTSSWTIADLLTGIRDRVQYVPVDDLQELQVDDANRGRFHPSDALTTVVKDSDLLRCAPAPLRRPKLPSSDVAASRPPDGQLQSGGAASSSNGHVANRHNSQASNRNDELQADYTRVFGNDGKTKEEDTDGSSTLPAQGNHFREASDDQRSRSPIRTVSTVSTFPGGLSAVEGREGKWPPLLRAAYEGDVPTARTLLHEGVNINCTMPVAGQKTPIYYAILFENPELVLLLLQHPEIDVNRQMRLGRSGSWTTPLREHVRRDRAQRCIRPS